jgi:CRP/FNR family cyclic AMP-dependent transcriptional regulator
MGGSVTTNAPYGLEVHESCLSCTLRAERLFCNVPDEALADFDEMKLAVTYPKGAILFVEGQEPAGIDVVCAGRVKLFACSRDGKTLVVQVAGPGDVLGVSAVISGQPHEATAETLEPSQVMFVKRDDFLSLLRDHGEIALRVAQLLSSACHRSQRQARALGLSRSAEERLAQFLLDRCDERGEPAGRGVRVRLGLTHDEMAQIIGVSRETVTRILGRLRRRDMLETRGGFLTVKDPAALRALSGL